MTEPIQVKPFCEYDELTSQLISRGMIIKDPLRAQRKLTQVGYYRLSGYWHTSRNFNYVDGKIVHKNSFQKNTNFKDIFEFYLFDKRLRIEFTDALERIEIYLRTIVAHEIGRLDPLAYLDKKQFTKKAFKPDSKIKYGDWINRHNRLMLDSKEDSIVDHRVKDKPVPIWVAVEAWDFGALSKFYSILNGKNQDLICDRLGLNNRNVLDNWLINLNGIRNRCAHHSRLCNRPNPRTFLIPQKGYFNTLKLSQNESSKFYGLISIVWFLLQQIGPSSSWIQRIETLINNKPKIPGFSYKSMGFPETGFPKKKFPKTITPAPEEKKASPVSSLNKSFDILESFISQVDKNSIEPEEKNILKDLIDKLVDAAEKIDEICPKT